MKKSSMQIWHGKERTETRLNWQRGPEKEQQVNMKRIASDAEACPAFFDQKQEEIETVYDRNTFMGLA